MDVVIFPNHPVNWFAKVKNMVCCRDGLLLEASGSLHYNIRGKFRGISTIIHHHRDVKNVLGASLTLYEHM